MTVTVLNLHFKGEFGKQLPNWARKIFLNCLGRILHVKVNEMHSIDRFKVCTFVSCRIVHVSLLIAFKKAVRTSPLS